MDLEPDEVIGAYRVVRRIACGGMGQVYEVEHRELGVRYALKIFQLDHGEVELMREKFRAEGKILARLRNPRLVRVYDLGVDVASGAPYFVMDLVLGPNGRPKSLADVRAERTVEESEVRRWYVDICEGLKAIHDAGIVHRDLKLENILLDAKGAAVIADFGISRLLGGNAVDVTAVNTIAVRTPDGKIVMGSGNYLAPEVRAGEPATKAADYYSLGVLVFRLLTGVWYEPKTEVLDLLAPFDPIWGKVVAALVDSDPMRRLPLTVDPPSDSRMGRWRLFLVLLLVGAFVAVSAFFLMRRSNGDQIPADELFAVPDFVR